MARTRVRLPLVSRVTRAAIVGALCASTAACTADKIRTTNDTRATTSTSATTPTQDATTAASDGLSVDRSTTLLKRSATTVTTKAGGSTTSTKSGTSGGTGGVALGASAIGGATFGTKADAAIATLTKGLGKPTSDQKDPGAACPGPDRIVRWGRLSVLFVGGKVAGWDYSGSPAGPPSLKLANGVTTGSTVTKLKAAYGDDLQLNADDPQAGPFGATFGLKSASTFGGFLTSTADTGTVTGLYSGTVCGE